MISLVVQYRSRRGPVPELFRLGRPSEHKDSVLPMTCKYTMNRTVDSSLRRGARVRLTGLNTQTLNGAEGKIVDQADANTGRFPVRLVSPPEAVAAYRNGQGPAPEPGAACISPA